jgi:predicted MFS family arabinose efflux permease
MFAIYSIPLSYGIFFKPMATELRWNRTVISGAFSLSRIVAGIVSIAMGWLIDKMGPRIVLIVCGLLCGIGSLLLSRMDATWQLYIFFGVIIGSGASIFAPMMSTVAKWFVQRRTLMTGIVISAVSVANVVGPPIVNLLITAYGWRLAYAILGVIVAIVAIVAAQFMRRDPQQMGLVTSGAKDAEEGRLKAINDAYSLREAIYTKQFWIFFIMSICYSFCYMAVIIHLAPHITDLGISSTTAANVLATIGISSVLGLVIMGNIGDKIGNKRTIIIGYVFLSFAMFLLIFIKEIELFYLTALMFGLGYAGIASQRPSMVAIMFGVKSHGLIFGAIDNSFTIGAAVGPILAGYIFDATGSYLLAFLVCTVIAVTGLILIIILNPTTTKQHRNSQH